WDMVDPVLSLRAGTDAERIAAARWLGGNPMPEAFPALVDALGNTNPDVLLWAAWALARLGNPAALEPVRQAMVRYGEVFSATHNGINKPCPSACLESLMRSVPTQTLIETLRQRGIHGGMRVDAAKILGARR